VGHGNSGKSKPRPSKCERVGHPERQSPEKQNQFISKDVQERYHSTVRPCQQKRAKGCATRPGYLSIALAKLGPFKITGLDISESFVKMASQYAKREGVVARFIHGSASDIPLEDGLFDLIVCRAAFKNFSEPLKALNEMHRVLKPGGRAIIIDLRKDASWNEIAAYVDGLHISRTSTWMTKFTFKHMLLKRAYTEGQMTALARDSDFKSCEIIKTAVGMEVRLLRQQPLAEQAA
jgi:ubiquinone/menaquinone biosynthesis C-methylase UbiE